MTPRPLARLALACLMTLTAAMAAPPPFLADKHKDLGLACKDCHGEADKADGVAMEQCLSCHESWDKLKKAPRAVKLHRNPHDGHYPDLDCNNCHHGHKAMENYCDNCHKK